MSRFWPVAEAAQADYEALRVAVLAGTPRCDAVAARFARSGLWGLIRRPAAEPVFGAVLVGAARPAWSPYGDPRWEALGDAYRLVLDADPKARVTLMKVGEGR